MKAITIASLAALALAGAACSETSPETAAPAPAADTAEVTPASAPVDDGFNLRAPGEGPATSSSDDGFNLPVRELGDGATDDGFNLPTDLPTSGGLNAVPEIDASILEEDEAEDGEDEIIRLEP